MSATILVVEDSAAIREPLVFLLEHEGYTVLEAVDGAEALVRFGSESPDLVLLDLMLPGISGLDVCQTIRRRSTVPIIMLTAKDTETDIVRGLELGADDYMTKPYTAGELKARIRSSLRRANTVASDIDDVLTVGPIHIDVARHQVKVSGKPVHVPLKEFELLCYLAENSGRVLTRGQLIDRVWGEDYYGDTKTLDVHVKRLRAKIETNADHPELLVTIRGLGYRLDDAGRD